MTITSKNEFSLRLRDALTGQHIYPSGKFFVTNAGSPAKLAITNAAEAAITQPGNIASGALYFRTAATVNAVDIFGYTSTGYAFQALGVKPGTNIDLVIDTQKLNQDIVVPFDVADGTVSPSAEVSTGFVYPNNVEITYFDTKVLVTTADAGTTIEIGTDGSGSNDPDGFVDLLDISTVGLKVPTIGYTVGTNNVWIDRTGGVVEFTVGALVNATLDAKIEGTDAAAADGNGIWIPRSFISGNAVDTLTFTMTGSPTTSAGYIIQRTKLAMPAY